MANTPQLVDRKPQKYAAINMKVNRGEIGNVVPDIYAEILQWISSNGIRISGAPIIRSLSIDYGNGDVSMTCALKVDPDRMGESGEDVHLPIALR